jgi:hypothetical protein
MMRWLLALCLVLLASPAMAQGQQCRTAPVGTSTANCASEALVVDSIAAIPAANVPESFCNGSLFATSGNSGTIAVCKTHVAVTVDSIEAVTAVPTAPGSLQFIVKDCGTVANNCSSPVSTIGSVTTSNTSNTAVDGTVSIPGVAAGHYIQITLGPGSCTFCAYGVTVAMH